MIILEYFLSTGNQIETSTIHKMLYLHTTVCVDLNIHCLTYVHT